METEDHLSEVTIAQDRHANAGLFLDVEDCHGLGWH